jgi:hypothetical protein
MGRAQSRNVMGLVTAALAVLLLPVLVASAGLVALLFYLFVAVPLCPRLAPSPAESIGTCANCFDRLCLAAVGLTLFVLLPLAVASFFTYRKRSRLP